MSSGRNYTRGAYLERQVVQELRALGYVAVSSKGSKSPVDVLAVKKGAVLLVQCKSGARAELHTSEWNVLHDLAAHVGGAAILVERRARGGRATWWRMTGPATPGARSRPREAFTP